MLGPVVLIVGAGALAGPRLGIDRASLSRLAFWVLGPAFVFNLFVTTTVEAATVARLTAAALAGMGAAVVVILVLAPTVGLGDRLRRAAVMTGAYGNVGNTGLAISVFALGDEALGTAGVLMLVINIAGITLGLGLASLGGDGDGGEGAGAGGGRGVLAAVRQAVVSPMPLAALAALTVNLVGIDLPLVVGRATGLAAQAMIPVMLLTLGLQLVVSGPLRVTRGSGVTALAKLVAAPLVATGVAAALGLGGTDLAVVAVQSAMPPAVFCVLVAIEYDLEPAEVTNTVVTTTLASMVTLPVVLALVT